MLLALEKRELEMLILLLIPQYLSIILNLCQHLFQWGGVGMNIDSNVAYTVIEKNSNDAIQIFKKNEIYCMSNFP